MKYIEIKPSDLLKSVIELSITYNTNLSTILLMAYLQKTWNMCEQENITHPILGSRACLIEKVISFFPQFRDNIIDAEMKDYQALKNKINIKKIKLVGGNI